MNRVDEVLLETKKIPELAIKSAKSKIGDDPEALWRHFVSTKHVTEQEVFQALARVLKLEYVELHGRDIPAEALSAVPASFSRAERLIPLEVRGERLFVGTPYPDNFRAFDEIAAISFKTIVTVIVAPTQLQETLDRYLRADEEIDKLSEEIEQAASADADDEDLSDDEDESPIVRFVNLLITQAIQDRASDIHVEPGEKKLVVRYRIDGVLHAIQEADKAIQKGVVSRLKVMSDIDIGERRKPQDGRMSIRYNGKTIDIRVVTLPTSWGEKVVMRILDHSNEKRSISSIQMSPRNEEIFVNAISKPHGMVLVTGPTGSGKAMPLDTKIPTPTGFTTMAEIQEHDEIFGADGKVYQISSVSEVFENAEMYEVTFSDGQKVITDRDHQWLVSTAKNRKLTNADRKQIAIDDYVDSHKVLTKLAYLSLEFSEDCGSRTAEELLNLLKQESIEYYTDVAQIEQALHMVDVFGTEAERETDTGVMKVREYPVEIALSGLCERIRQQHAVVQSSDVPVIRTTTYEMFTNGLKNSQNVLEYAVPVNAALELPEKELPVAPYLMGSKIFEEDGPYQNIPEEYQWASIEQRTALLNGLFNYGGEIVEDADGTLRMSFRVEDEDLSKSIVRLLRGLGVKATVSEYILDEEIVKYSDRIFDIRFSTPLVNVSENVEGFGNVDEKLWNDVVSIRPVANADAKCISVSSPDFTYLVGEGFITTSNSTTIYTALGEVSKPTVNVITVEDPVEKKIPGISQMQINNKAGMTFSNALRSILRADPDIVFLGEIRDAETAKIAVDASMTGHLVLSTLHTNGAPEAAARLSEMGVEPYLVGSSVSCVVAQRLARKLCNDCKVPVASDPLVIERVGFPHPDAQLYAPKGCVICSNTGYRGRVALTEVLEINEYLEPLIIAQKSANEIRREAEKHGFVGLREDGWAKVADGLTTIEEVLRVAA